MSDGRPRVVYWFKQPTPYAVSRFNAVAQRGNLDFEAWFSQVREPNRSWSVNETTWRFHARYLPRRELFGIDLRVPLAELAETRPDLFILEYDRLELALGAVAGRMASRRIAFRVLPNFDAWSKRTWWREASKQLLFRAVDHVKVPGPDGARLAHTYGVPNNRISYVAQSIDVAHYSCARAVSADERVARRQALGLKGCVFLYVGRVWSGKGLDELFTAYRKLSEESLEVSLLMVGDGTDTDRYERDAADLAGVHFAGFVQPAEIPGWYSLADCLVFPTHGDPNGLVVEEAFAAGLPVICSDAAGDIRQRLPHGEVGFVFPTGNADALTDRMREMARDPDLRRQMALKTELQVSNRSDEQYAIDFERFADAVLNEDPRRGLSVVLVRMVGRILLAFTRVLRSRPAPVQQPGSAGAARQARLPESSA